MTRPSIPQLICPSLSLFSVRLMQKQTFAIKRDQWTGETGVSLVLYIRGVESSRVGSRRSHRVTNRDITRPVAVTDRYSQAHAWQTTHTHTTHTHTRARAHFARDLIKSWGHSLAVLYSFTWSGYIAGSITQSSSTPPPSQTTITSHWVTQGPPHSPSERNTQLY